MGPRSQRKPDRTGWIVAVEGVSGAGKSRLARALARRQSAPLLPEAWRRLRPRPSLSFTNARELLRLERQLLDEEASRWRSATRLAGDVPLVVCDTGFTGPLTYTLGLARLDPALDRVRRALVERATRSVRDGRWGIPDAVLFVDTPLRLASRRASRAGSSHPTRWRARHVAVGRIERAFWLGEYGRVAPGRLFVLDGRKRANALVARARTLLSRLPERAGSREARRVLSALSRPLNDSGAS